MSRIASPLRTPGLLSAGPFPSSRVGERLLLLIDFLSPVSYYSFSTGATSILFFLSLPLFISLSFRFSVSLSLCLSISLSHCLSVSLSLCLTSMFVFERTLFVIRKPLIILKSLLLDYCPFPPFPWVRFTVDANTPTPMVIRKCFVSLHESLSPSLSQHGSKWFRTTY